MKKTLIFLLTSILLVSCQNSELDYVEPTQEIQIIKKKNSLTVDEVKKAVTNFLNSESSTRGEQPQIESITPILYTPTSNINPLGLADQFPVVQRDTLLFLSNLANSQGYVLTLAHVKAGGLTIASVDEGNMDPQVLYKALAIINGDREVFEDYETSGPGIYTLKSGMRSAQFINPNTFNFIDEDSGEEMVGDLNPDAFKKESLIVPESTNATSSSSVDYEDTMADIVVGIYCMNYSIRLTKIINNNNTYYPGMEDLSHAIDFSDPNYQGIYYDFNYEDWQTTKNKTPLLSKYEKWNQHSPFNDKYPVRYQCGFFGSNRTAPAGCFPLAIAKTLSKFETPAKIGSTTIKWEYINSATQYGSDWSRAIAEFLNEIRTGVDAWCFYQGTFTFPNKARNFLKSCGLSNVSEYKYNFDKITAMIDQGKPVFIYAIPNWDITASHAWNIDGYKIKERTVNIGVYKDQHYLYTTQDKQYQYLVHCDFGWSGKNNGYFISGIFKLNSEENEYDHPNGELYDLNFNKHIRIITYDK